MASVHMIPLYPSTALTDNATGTAYSLEMKQVDFAGHVIASSVNAATTIASKIQHSPDGSNWYDLVSFTNIVGASGSEVKTISAPILSQVRAVITLSGATKAATVKISLFCDKA